MKNVIWAVLCTCLISAGPVMAGPAIEGEGDAHAPSPTFHLAQAESEDQREGPRMQQRRQRQEMHQRMSRGMASFSHLAVQHADALGLTDEQLGKLLRLQRQHQQDRGEIRNRLQAAMTATGQMLLDPTVEKEAVDEHVDAHAEAFQAWADNMWEERRRVLDILDPEQREALTEKLADLTPKVPDDHPREH